MAQSLCPPLSESWILPAAWGPAQPLPPSDRDCGCSPASSPNSWGSAPAGSPGLRPRRPGSRAAPRVAAAERRGARSSRPGGGQQRQSASEREKLRMRTLARALHELRRYLPPSVAPAGQSLTKIETLRLAIRYIGHLSAVLGLSEENLRRRRRRHSDAALPRGCPLCPDGGPGLGSAAPAAGSWASSATCPGAPAAPERLGSRVLDVGRQVTPPYCPRMQSLPHVSQGRAPDAALWTLPQIRSGTLTSPQPGNQATPWTPPPAAPELTAVYQGIPVSPESYLLPETPPLLPRSACQRLQPQTQWGYWSHSAEMLPSSEDQGPGPTLQLNDESPLQSSGLQLSGCPEFWQEDLEGGHLGIF